ncbi:DNA damage-inducible protein DinB [Roseivivax isoporae LMG 25204]|uniref:DNA damage-inducible protein DinB n=2 Tax=Roseivivax TaxID=93682 RepID=X7F3Y0_9RHOB|nr:DNA damage-inducible protein DinB [Roseivivax isoporae LMG 25204]
MAMVDAGYCLWMARYNAWQNRQLRAIFADMSAAELAQERGAFFGSLLGTANHVLWADRMWMSRLVGGPAPGGGISDSPRFTDSARDWDIARFRADADILLWAERLRSVELTGMLSWHSGALGRRVEKPRALCVVHMFNHQTHHRGQIHAMLTAAGRAAPVTDLAFMPEDGPSL